MIIKEITSQHRRDFTAIMECEFCKDITENVSGYDDNYFHQIVIPEKKCNKCNKSTLSEGGKIIQRRTRYPEGFQV